MTQHSTTKDSLQLFWHFTRPYEKYFYLSTLGAGLGVFIQDVVPPLIIARAFDQLQHQVDSGQPLNLSSFGVYIIWFAVSMVLSMIIWRVQVWFTWQFEVSAIKDLAVHIFDRLQRLGSTFHANHFGGALVSQANKLLSAYEKAADEFTWSITTTVVVFITTLGILIARAPLYAVFFAIVSGLFLWLAIVRTKKTMVYDRALASSESLRTAKLADMITNVSAVSAFAGEKHEYQLFDKQATSTLLTQRRLLRQVMINDTMSHSITNSLDLISVASGIVAITIFHQPAGVLFLAVNYTMQLTNRLWESRRTIRNLNRAFGDATDMTEILQLEPEIKDEVGAKELKVNDGEVRLESIDFAYPDQTHKLLFNKLSIDIKPGEKVGLVGHSGGGKTSLTKILLRFMDLQNGKILIDGQDISKVTQSSLRQNIAYVPQEPLLFHRTIAENISYGRPEASLNEIENVAKMAHAHEFIKELPKNYSTLVGERGVKLSGGQRQRIAIARAMLRGAPILVLDEATSALDSESEKLIQDALWRLMEGRTAIVIAHRLSTIQKMDRIIVMESGEIVEQGTHKELLDKKGIYAGLWDHQSGGFLEE